MAKDDRIDPTVLEAIWRELDLEYDTIVHGEHGGCDPEEELTEEELDALAWGEERGRAQGLAKALAIIMSAGHPDVNEIRRIAALRAETREEGAPPVDRKKFEPYVGKSVYHRGRELTLLSVGVTFAHVRSISTCSFNVPLQELVTELDEYGPAGPH
jgi:hypothetical protein